MTDEVFHQFFPFQAFWVVLHLIYFSKYYSRYSDCFHKINSLRSKEKAGLISKDVSEEHQEMNRVKATRLRRFSYYPAIGIGVLNTIALPGFWGKYFFTEYYYVPIWFMIGALFLILLANMTQGSKVLGGSKSGGFGPWI